TAQDTSGLAVDLARFLTIHRDDPQAELRNVRRVPTLRRQVDALSSVLVPWCSRATTAPIGSCRRHPSSSSTRCATRSSTRSCLAVRFGRTHSEGGARTPLMSCEICGTLPGASSCEPLLVGGEVIGAVLVNQRDELDDTHRRRLREAVGQAAPVLANLRNLAIAELRASTDALTGLPNQRAVQDTLKRMVAQSARTMSPLAALLIDLDHFKQINDLHGHDRGDEVLAAVGVALKNVVRDSDFVGRYGGEEFLVLLPATDQEGGIQLGEAIRRAIAAISLPNFEQRITASVGVAVLPQDGGDSVTLFRSADRALYAAKRNGRDRLETASSAPLDGADIVVAPAAEAA
ncbi:MAG: GGDEF domain-containing protein, partial [Gaiellales bacterium]